MQSTSKKFEGTSCTMVVVVWHRSTEKVWWIERERRVDAFEAGYRLNESGRAGCLWRQARRKRSLASHEPSCRVSCLFFLLVEKGKSAAGSRNEVKMEARWVKAGETFAGRRVCRGGGHKRRERRRLVRARDGQNKRHEMSRTRKCFVYERCRSRSKKAAGSFAERKILNPFERRFFSPIHETE